MNTEIIELATKLGKTLKDKNLMIATAESCTGGGIAQAITEIPNSSTWFDRGYVTYSNDAKIKMLEVKESTLISFGAVSEQVAIEMVEGVVKNCNANVVVAVTGIAGPDGGTKEKPIGTVFFAWKINSKNCCLIRKQFSGNRAKVRQQSIKFAIQSCIQVCLDS